MEGMEEEEEEEADDLSGDAGEQRNDEADQEEEEEEEDEEEEEAKADQATDGAYSRSAVSSFSSCNLVKSVVGKRFAPTVLGKRLFRHLAPSLPFALSTINTVP